MKPTSLLLLAALLGAPLAAPVWAQNATAVTILGVGHHPESVAADKDDNAYVSDLFADNILRVTPQGTVSVFAHIPGPGVTLGVKFDRLGNLCVAHNSDPAHRGIWKVTPSGQVSRFSALPGAVGPNDMAFDGQGNMYVSNSGLGAVWVVDTAGNSQLWKADPLLTPTAAFGFPLPVGANGLDFNHEKGVLYVNNTSAGMVVQITVNPDGSAGAASVLAQDPSLVGADGMALDLRGNIYVAVNIQNRIAVVTPDGSLNSFTDPLFSNPSSIAFGHRGDQKSVSISNFALFPTGNPALAGVLKLDIGIPGKPLP